MSMNCISSKSMNSSYPPHCNMFELLRKRKYSPRPRVSLYGNALPQNHHHSLSPLGCPPWPPSVHSCPHQNLDVFSLVAYALYPYHFPFPSPYPSQLRQQPLHRRSRWRHALRWEEEDVGVMRTWWWWDLRISSAVSLSTEPLRWTMWMRSRALNGRTHLKLLPIFCTLKKLWELRDWLNLTWLSLYYLYILWRVLQLMYVYIIYIIPKNYIYIYYGKLLAWIN